MRSRSIIALALFCSAALLPATGAAAQTPIELKSSVSLLKAETLPDGSVRESRVDPATVVPGDRLVFSTSFRNVGADPVDNFTITKPVPEAVSLASTAEPSMTVSVDGGRTWGTLGQLQVTGADGETRGAQAGDVTHVKWIVRQVAPGEAGVVEYTAIVR